MISEQLRCNCGRRRIFLPHLLRNSLLTICSIVIALDLSTLLINELLHGCVLRAREGVQAGSVWMRLKSLDEVMWWILGDERLETFLYADIIQFFLFFFFFGDCRIFIFYFLAVIEVFRDEHHLNFELIQWIFSRFS